MVWVSLRYNQGKTGKKLIEDVKYGPEKKSICQLCIPWKFYIGSGLECSWRALNFLTTISYFNLHYRRLGDVLRRKRYSKRPGRGKASSFPSTSEVQVEVNRQQIGGPSSKTMLHESRAAFLASQSSTRLNSRSALLSERPAKVQYMVSFFLTMLLFHMDTFTNTSTNTPAQDLWLESIWNYNYNK